MIGFSRSTFRKSVAPALGYAGSILADLEGDSVGNSRTVTGLNVTNNKTVPIWVEVEQESNKVPVSMTVQPGETKRLDLSALIVTWTTTRIPMWNGLNIRWKEPA